MTRPPSPNKRRNRGVHDGASVSFPSKSGHAGFAPGRPASTTKLLRVISGASGLVTNGTVRKCAVHSLGVTSHET
jgi:hypothetical protein